MCATKYRYKLASNPARRSSNSTLPHYPPLHSFSFYPPFISRSSIFTETGVECASYTTLSFRNREKSTTKVFGSNFGTQSLGTTINPKRPFNSHVAVMLLQFLRREFIKLFGRESRPNYRLGLVQKFQID